MHSKKPFIGIVLDYELPSSKGDALRGYARSPWYALREEYISSLYKTGSVPFCIPYYEEDIEQYLNKLDGLLIPGGRDMHPSLYGETPCHPSVHITPKKSEFELAITQKALERDLPILGICGGLQIINVALGGTLIQDIPAMLPKALIHRDTQNPTELRHSITIEKDSRLYSIIGEDTTNWVVNSNHHQSVKKLGKGLRISALASDGIIEAIESTKHRFVLGIEWHPEYLHSPIDKSIFNAFAEACCHA